MKTSFLCSKIIILKCARRPRCPSRVTRMDFSAEMTFLVSERIRRVVKSAINVVKSPARPTIFVRSCGRVFCFLCPVKHLPSKMTVFFLGSYWIKTTLDFDENAFRSATTVPKSFDFIKWKKSRNYKISKAIDSRVKRCDLLDWCRCVRHYFLWVQSSSCCHVG